MYDYAIKINDLGKKYRLYKKPIDKVLDAFGLRFWSHNDQEFWALRNMSLEVKKGERLGIIGRNGAGKSTLLKTIIGSVTPTEGTIKVVGNIQALMELGTGFHPEFTGRQNIRASLSYQGLTAKQISLKEEEIIDFAELEEFIDQPIKTYSAGMYARLAFSTATAIEPEILIIDEVLGAGDAYFAGKCVERMRRLTNESGATVLFVSHDLNSVLQLCDRVVWVDRGKIRESGEPLSVIKKYNAMVRKEEETRLKARDLKVLKKQAVMLDRQEDIYKPVLFHFVGGDGQALAGSHRIYHIKLLSGSETIGDIDVGGPMDNSPDQHHYVMDTKGYMDWGQPKKDKQGYYREIADFKGKYKHAPFEFLVPKHLIENGEKLQLEIEAKVGQAEAAVEIYNGTSYVRLGPLVDGITTFPVDTSSLTERDDENSLEDGNGSVLELFELTQLSSDVSEYGNKQMQISAVRILDENGKQAKVFETQKPLSVEFDYVSKTNVQTAVFVFCIYTTDGKVASQWIVDTQSLQLQLPSSGTFAFTVDRLLIGRGSFVASAAIFKHLSGNGEEAESYHVLDRSIHFEVVQPLGDLIERGICLQPFEVRIYD